MSEIRVEIDLQHPPERVWRALTDPELISSWFVPTDLQPRTGEVFRARPGRIPGFSGAFDIEVIDVRPARLLHMQWRGDQLHAHVAWELDPAPGGCRLTVRQAGFLGVNGTMRRRELRRAYQEMFEEKLPVTLEALARPGHLIAGGAQPPAGLNDPSDPWALSDPLVTAGVALALPESDPALPLAQSHARPIAVRRLASAFPLEERVRAAAITVTVALVVVTVGWLWLTRPAQNTPPMRYPQGTLGPVAGGQPGAVLPSGVVPTGGVAPAASGGPIASEVPGGSGDPVVLPSAAAPTGPASPPPVVLRTEPLTASYATDSSTGILGYKVTATVRLHNPGTAAHSGWTVVLTVPAGAELQDAAGTVDARKDGEKVTITPKAANRDIAGGGDMVFTVTFGGTALLGIGSGGITGCTIDGATCTHA